MGLSSRAFGRWLAAVFLLAAPGMALDQESDDIDAMIDSSVDIEGVKVLVIRVRHLQGEMKVDGVLDEEFWKHTPKYEIERESYPALLAPSPVKTEAYFARLNDDLVVGFKAYDPKPEDIQAPIRDRDGIERDDYVGISLDLAGKMLTTHEFYVSASGGQGDWVRNRVDGQRSRDWDAEWRSAAKITDAGYTVEMKIPLNELPIPIGDDDLKRLVLFKRHYPRDVRHHLGRAAIIKPVPNPVLPQKKLQIIPSLTFFNEWERDLDPDAHWEWEDESKLSMDMEYRLTPSLALLGTFNPNYLEVEADLTETSINDPFTKLVPEKRPFFNRGTEAFGTLYDLVYTRNIEDPNAGLKLVGSAGDLTTGNFVVGDRETRLIVPGNLSSKSKTLDWNSTSTALRQRYDIKRGMSAGAIFTSRYGESDYHNVVGGVDIYAKPNRADEFWAQWVASDSRYPAELEDKLDEDVDDDYVPEEDEGIPGETRFNERVLRVDPTKDYNDDAINLRYKHNSRTAYALAQYRDVGEDFRADLGYMPRVDYRLGSVSAGVNHYVPYKDKGQMRFRLSGTYLKQESQAGEPILESRDLWLNYWGLLQSWVRIGYRNRDRVAKRVRQDTLVIEGNAPEFNEEQVEIRIESSPLRNGRLVLAGRFGDQIDTDNYRLGDIFELKPSLSYSLGNSFEVSIEDTYRKLDVDEGKVFSENYFRLNLTYKFTRASFLRVTIVDDWIRRNPELYLYSEELSLERETDIEMLFAWKPTQKNLLLVGANFGATDEEELANPRIDEMACYIKYVRPFNL